MELPTSPDFILSCEHAGNRIPEQYQSFFDSAEETLNSHRGWDPGALQLAEIFSKESGIPLFSYPNSRLLIDPNRSPGHPKLFSEFTRSLPKSEKQKVVEKYYSAYRSHVTEQIQEKIKQKGTVIHIGVHSFTPVLNQKERNFEIGLLYDPSRILERNVSRLWKSVIRASFPEFRIRMNQPYKGISDGFTTNLRKIFDHKSYVGIEIEVNQKLVFEKNAEWNRTASTLAGTLLTLKGALQ